MISITEFFRNLPGKCCANCGTVIQEQADCYMTKCEECNDFEHYAIQVK